MFIPTITENQIQIKLRGNKDTFNFQLDQIKQLAEKYEGRYNGEHKVWIFPKKQLQIDELSKVGIIDKAILLPKEKDYKEVDLDESKVEYLREYQKDALKYMLAHDGKALLRLGCGAGKTVTSLSYFFYTEHNYPLLIICPVGIKYQWAEEIHKFSKKKLNIVICEGLNSLRNYSEYDVVICNYDLFAYHLYKEGNKNIISDDVKELLKTHFKGVILDECQRLKNFTKAKSVKVIRKIVDFMPNIIALSATPLDNKLIDFYSILNILRPDIFHNFYAYKIRYCNARIMRWGWDYSGASNVNQLRELTHNHVMYSKSNKEIQMELPIAEPIPIKYTLKEKDKKLYNKIAKGKSTYTDLAGQELKVKRIPNKTFTTKNMVLRKYIAEKKIPYIKQFLKDFLEDTDEKIIVFTQHHTVIDVLQEAFKKQAVKFDGRSSDKVREKAKKDFIKGNKRIFLGQQEAAGIGLDGLQKVCHIAIYVELPWKPIILEQTIGRIERSGTKFENVLVYFPIFKDTVEDHILEVLVEKENNIEKILDEDPKYAYGISKRIVALLETEGLDNDI